MKQGGGLGDSTSKVAEAVCGTRARVGVRCKLWVQRIYICALHLCLKHSHRAHAHLAAWPRVGRPVVA